MSLTDCWTNVLKVRLSERRRHPTLCSLQAALPARPSRRQRQSNTQRAAFNITAVTSTGTVWGMRHRERGKKEQDEREELTERLGSSLFHAKLQEVPSQPLNCHPLIYIPKGSFWKAGPPCHSPFIRIPLKPKKLKAVGYMMTVECKTRQETT